MKITLKNLEKRFNHEKVFTNLNYQFCSGHAYALVGHNGSGKSTLLQIIAGYMLPSKGDLLYENEQPLPVEEIYQYLTIATPYLELIEEFTLKELLQFHFSYKQPRENISINKIMELAYLEDAENKFVKNFSSGMKQRLKLALAFFSDSRIVLLDEPTSNLDKKGFNWYLEQIQKIKNELIIIASNEPKEYNFCQETVQLENFKLV